MKKWLKPEEHSPPGEAGNYGWVHPKTGLHYNGVWGGHAKAAREFGFNGDTDTEVNDNAVEAGYTRWYVGGDEVGVHFNKDHPDAPQRAKEILAYHAQNQQGRMLLADTGKDYYHGTSLKDAHDFIDRVSTKLKKGRKETDYARMKRELGESRAATMIRMALNEARTFRGEHHASWISPTDIEHKLPATDPSGQMDHYLHVDWIADNHKEHIEPKHWKKHVGPDGYWNDDSDIVESRILHSMMKGGWIRKATKDSYGVGRQEDVGRVLAHVRRHHPKVDTVRIDVNHKRWDKTGTSGLYRVGSVAAYRESLEEGFNVKIADPHKLKLKRTGKKYDRENDEHLYDFEIKHPAHGVVATLHGRANTPEPGYHGLNIGALYLSDDFAKKIGAGAEGAWDYETAAGALGVAGIRQIGRELRRHGFTHARTDSRESGVRGRPNNKHNGGGSFGYIDDKPLPETAESLICMALSEGSEHDVIRKVFADNPLAVVAHRVRENPERGVSYQWPPGASQTDHDASESWSGGGCHTAACAIQRVIGGKLKSVVDARGDHHHVVVHKGGSLYDADGAHTEQQMLSKLAHAKHVPSPLVSRMPASSLGAYGYSPEVAHHMAGHLRAALGKRSLGEATLRPHSDNVPGSGRARYDIEHEGQRIGNLAIQTVGSAPGLPAGSRAGKLGVKINPEARGSRTLVRDVLRQLRDRHPDLTHVGGFRLSGTRAHWDNDQKSTTDRYTWVKLR